MTAIELTRFKKKMSIKLCWHQIKKSHLLIFLYITNILKYPPILHSKTASNLSSINYLASVTSNISEFWRLLKLKNTTCAFPLSLSTSALHSVHHYPLPTRGGSSITAHGTQLTEPSSRKSHRLLLRKRQRADIGVGYTALKDKYLSLNT